MGRGKRWLRGLGIALLIGVVLVLLVLAGGFTWLQTGSGERFVRGQIDSQLEALLATGAVEFGDYDWDFDHLVVQDIRIHGSTHQDVLVVPEVALELDLDALLDWTVHVESARIESPRLVLHALPDGSFDLPTLKPSDTPSTTRWLPEGTALRIDDLLLTGADVQLPASEVHVAGLDLQGVLAMDANTLALNGLQVDWTQALPDLGVGTVSGDLRFVDADLAAFAAVAGLDGASVVLRGRVPGLLDGALQPAVDVAAWVPEAFVVRVTEVLETPLPEGLDLAPGIRAGFVLGGPLDALQYGGSVALGGDHVELLGTAVAAADWSTRGTAVLTDASTLARFGAPVQRGQIVAAYQVDAVAGVIETDSRAWIRGLSAQGTWITGADVDVRGQVSPLQDVAGQARFWGLVAPGQADRPLSGSARYTFAENVAAAMAHVTDGKAAGFVLDADGSYGVDTSTAAVRTLQLELADDVRWALEQPTSFGVGPAGITNLKATVRGTRAGEPLGLLVVDAPELGGDIRLSAELEAIELGPLASLAEVYTGAAIPALAGQLGGTVRLAMAAGDTPDVEADLALSAFQLESGTPIQVVLDARTAGQDVLAHVQIDGPAWNLMADGQVPLDGQTLNCEGELEATVLLPQVEWTALRAAFPLLPENPYATELGGVLQLGGSACTPRVRFDGETTVAVSGRSVRVEAELEDGPDNVLVLDARVSVDGIPVVSAGASLDHAAPDELLAAEDPLTGLGDWRARARLLDPSIAALLPEGPVTGVAHGRLAAEGQGLTVASTEGSVSLEDLVVSERPLERLAAQWTTLGEVIYADAMLTATDDIALEGHGEVGTSALMGDPQTAFSVEVPESRVPLEVLEALSMGMLAKSSGEVLVDAQLDGTLGDPQGRGRLQVVDGHFVLLPTGVLYHDAQVDVGVSDRAVRIERFVLSTRPDFGRFAKQESGVDLTVTGQVALTPAMEVVPDLKIELADFYAAATQEALAKLDGEVTVKGNLTAPIVRGQIVVVDGRFDLDRNVFIAPGAAEMDPDIEFVGETPAIFVVEEKEDPTMAMLAGADVEITVTIRRQVGLKAVLPLAADMGLLGAVGDASIDAELGGEVRLVMQDGVPEVFGRIDTQGEAQLLTAKFDIEEGSIVLSGDNYSNPDIDLLLKRESSVGTVRARVRGTPEALEIADLTSDAGLTEAEMLSQLMFGRPLSEMGDSEGNAGAAVVQQALVGMAGKSVEDAIGVRLVDSFDFDSQAGVSLGWRLSDDVFVTVRLDPNAEKDENSTEVMLSWYLTKLLHAELHTGDAAESAGWLQAEQRF